MKNIIYLALALIALPAFAQNPEQPKVEVKQEQKVDMKDAFLGFVLQKAEKYTEKTEAALGKAVDIAKEEAPELAREFIVWRACMHGIKAIFPLVIICVIIACYIKISKLLWGKHEESPRDDWDGGAIAFNIVGGVGGAVGIVFLSFLSFNNFLPFVQCLVAPKIYIIEQVLNLVQK